MKLAQLQLAAPLPLFELLSLAPLELHPLESLALHVATEFLAPPLLAFFIRCAVVVGATRRRVVPTAAPVHMLVLAIQLLRPLRSSSSLLLLLLQPLAPHVLATCLTTPLALGLQSFSSLLLLLPLPFLRLTTRLLLVIVT
jgi:hypothetical protein